MNGIATTAVAPASAMTVSLAAVSTAVENFNRIAAGLAALQAKYGGVLYDCKTDEGMEAARKAKREVAKPRIELEACRMDAKRPILKLGKDLDSEAATVAAAIAKIEDPIALQIKTEEARQQREKDEAAAKELSRVTAIRERIEKMRSAPQRAVENRLGADKMTECVDRLVAIDIDDSFAEFRRRPWSARQSQYGWSSSAKSRPASPRRSGSNRPDLMPPGASRKPLRRQRMPGLPRYAGSRNSQQKPSATDRPPSRRSWTTTRRRWQNSSGRCRSRLRH